MMRKIICCFIIMLSQYCFAFSLPLNELTLPKNFHITIYANKLPGVRELALGKDNIVYAGSYNNHVYAIVKKQDQTKIYTIGKNLVMPHGVAFHNRALYVAELNKVIKYPNITDHLANPPSPVTVINNLPDKRWHGYKTLHFGPQGKLYLAIGVPCNSCLNTDSRFGTIMQFNADGSDGNIFANGIRNSVGFDWQPQTKVMWFSDNGQDWLGDNFPPDEINRAPHAKMDFGFPYFIDNNHAAPKFGQLKSSENMMPPAFELPAHVAALGIRFYQGQQFPKDYQDKLFIAEHGSWNRSNKIGYRISMLDIKDGKASHYQQFVTGWLEKNGHVWGRPNDILVLPDGSLLVSDDLAGVIYRIYYQA